MHYLTKKFSQPEKGAISNSTSYKIHNLRINLLLTLETLLIKKGQIKIPTESGTYLLRTDVYYSINLIFPDSEKMTESKQLLK